MEKYDESLHLDCEPLLKRVRRKIQDFDVVNISLDSFFYNLFLIFSHEIKKDENKLKCLDVTISLLTKEQIIAFDAWCSRELVPIDYWFNVNAFVPDTRNESNMDETQKILRPIFIQIHKAIKKKIKYSE